MLGRVRDNFNPLSSVLLVVLVRERSSMFLLAVTLNSVVFKPAQDSTNLKKTSPFLSLLPLALTLPSISQSHFFRVSFTFAISPLTSFPKHCHLLVALTHPCQDSSETTSFHLMDKLHLTELELPAAPPLNTSV